MVFSERTNDFRLCAGNVSIESINGLYTGFSATRDHARKARKGQQFFLDKFYLTDPCGQQNFDNFSFT